jgi:hypothetical protein
MSPLQTTANLPKQEITPFKQNTRFQEKLEQLKRQKTSHSTEELDNLGWARYAEVQSELETLHHGNYVMIEVESGDYFVGKTPQDALCQAEAVHAGKAFCLIRIGYRAVHKLRMV